MWLRLPGASVYAPALATLPLCFLASPLLFEAGNTGKIQCGVITDPQTGFAVQQIVNRGDSQVKAIVAGGQEQANPKAGAYKFWGWVLALSPLGAITLGAVRFGATRLTPATQPNPANPDSFDALFPDFGVAPVAPIAPPTLVASPSVAPASVAPVTVSPMAIKVAESSVAVCDKDIFDEIADTELSLLIPCKTGSGKTTTVREIAYRTWLRTNKTVQFWWIDPKNEPCMGMELTDRYFSPGTPGDWYGNVDHAFRSVIDILDGRIKSGGDPSAHNEVVLIIDEWMALQSELTLSDPQFFKQLLVWLTKIIVTGRHYKVRCILITQSPILEDCGFKTGGLRDNVSICALGRMGKKNDVGYHTITKCLGNDAIIPKHQADQLRSELMRLIPVARQHGDVPIMLTTQGTPRLSLLPNLAGVERVLYAAEQSDLGDELSAEFEDESDAEAVDPSVVDDAW